QSASILIVCGGHEPCGRNTNNPRWLYINVDDNPDPFPELRRLLDSALAHAYGDQAYKLVQQKKLPQARAAAEKAVGYAPSIPDSHMMLGFLGYLAGNKTAALEEFEKARRLNPNFREQWDASVNYFNAFRAILDDKEFVKKVLPEK